MEGVSIHRSSHLAARFGERVTDGFDHAFEGSLVHRERSPFQDIEVYDHIHFGRVLTLDGLVQTTERDEFCYHEMLVHPALCALERPERVLVIGGGDGGTLRHVLMHDPAEAVMCEIDEAVARVSREHLPALSGGAFEDPRARLHIGDGAAYVAEHERRRLHSMRAEDFDQRFDDGEDVTHALDLSQARRPGEEQRRVNVDFPVDLLRAIDREARRIGVTRQAFIKLRLADTLAGPH
jgi:hypothetical protein